MVLFIIICKRQCTQVWTQQQIKINSQTLQGNTHYMVTNVIFDKNNSNILYELYLLPFISWRYFINGDIFRNEYIFALNVMITSILNAQLNIKKSSLLMSLDLHTFKLSSKINLYSQQDLHTTIPGIFVSWVLYSILNIFSPC